MNLHYTEHGARQEGDSLDLMREESDLLQRLFVKWAKTTPEGKDRGAAVTAKWDHGTVGKLLLEHSAVWLAAALDVARVLDAVGAADTASAIRRRTETVRPHIGRMAERSHGVQPINLAIAPEFTGAVEALHEHFSMEIATDEGVVPLQRLEIQLGNHRGNLRGAKYIRKHAPVHPDRSHWFNRMPFVVRIQTAFDRLRGFPWAESGLADRNLAEDYDREVS